MKLGFACHWDPDPPGTWSGTPWRFREALLRHTTVVDVGLSLSSQVRFPLRVAHARYRNGGWSSTWKHSRVTDVLRQHRVISGARAAACDAVVEIQDLAVLDRPFFLYQDLSYDALLHHFDDEVGVHQFPGLTPRAIERRRERQRRVYEASSGVLAMSAWLAKALVELSGLPAEKVFTVPPGINALATENPSADLLAGRGDGVDAGANTGPSLLFLGKDFHRKGGDLVVAAMIALRRDYDPDLTLTIAGPATWPLDGPPPEGVRFLGRVPPAAVTPLLDAHDLLVLPSRFEAFGIVFAEALSRGLPCVGRDAFAMPEVIRRGHNGDLIPRGEERPTVLAETIAGVLDDPGIWERCAQDRGAVGAYYSWDRAAAATVEIVGSALGGRS